MKNNKKLSWLLGILLLGIWGTIAHQLVSALGSNDIYDAEPSALPDPDVTIERYVYKDNVRDPFYFKYTPPVKRDTAKNKAVVVKPVSMVSPLKLTGILSAGKKRTAIIEGTAGAVFFLHEGDTLQGVKLTSITDKRVSYLLGKTKNEWVLLK